MSPCNMLVDLSNITHITRHGKTMKKVKGTDPYFIPLLFKEAVSLIDALVRQYQVDGALIAVDAKSNWRKEIYPAYKGNRTKELRDDAYEETVATINLLAEFFRQCTSIPVVSVPRAEADDIIAVAAQDLKTRSLIVSSDRDFVQLVNDNVALYTPAQKKFREAEDPKYYLFEKVIRGDAGDNIMSAYPRVRATKLEAAWKDPVEMANLMETVLRDGRVVKDAYAFNKSMIDLWAQPQEVRQAIRDELVSAREIKQFSNIELYKFCGQNNLASVANWLEARDRLFTIGFCVA